MNLARLILTFILISLLSCDDDTPDNPTPKPGRPKSLDEYNKVAEGLKDYFTKDGYFEIGTAIEPGSIDISSEAALMKRHFSCLTAENVMKWSSIQPTQGNFRFDNPDKIVNFAQANGMKVRGHTLVWHSQCPDWVFEKNGVTATKDTVLNRMRKHINTVVTRYKGKVYAWDVVNEAIDDGSGTYRTSKWYNICGEDFIFEAFKAARQADPQARLFYNDYNEVDPTKREKIYSLVSRLKAQGLVDGFGMQGHWNIEYPSSDLIVDAINRYASLGVELHVTEMDVSVYTSNSAPQTDYNADIESKLNTAYIRYFNLFRLHKQKITNVTFWGITDRVSWLNNWPVAGRQNYPLLFDRSNNPKRAYFGVINF